MKEAKVLILIMSVKCCKVLQTSDPFSWKESMTICYHIPTTIFLFSIKLSLIFFFTYQKWTELPLISTWSIQDLPNPCIDLPSTATSIQNQVVVLAPTTYITAK